MDVQSVDEVANDIGYAGYLFNDESQNYHVRNREYSPKLGRWLQRDPLEYPDGMNRIREWVWASASAGAMGGGN